MLKKQVIMLTLFISFASSTFCQAAIPFTVRQLIKKHPFISLIFFISGTWFVYNINKRLKKSFHDSVATGDYWMVRKWLLRGVNINESNQVGFAPIHIAALYGHSKIIDILYNKNNHVIGSQSGELSKIALHFAVENGHLNAVKTLVSLGSDINKTTKFNETPLHLAVKNKHKDVAGYLILKGADEGKKGLESLTPLELVSQQNSDYYDQEITNFLRNKIRERDRNLQAQHG